MSSYPPMPCGIGIYARDLSQALARRGHEVVVIATEYPGAPREEKGNPRVLRTWKRGSEEFHREILETLESEGPFDVIEFQFEYGLWPVIPLDSRGLWLLRNAKALASVVTTLHTVRYSEDAWWRRAHEELLKLSDAVIVHHFMMENALYRMLRRLEKTYVVPHGSAPLPGEKKDLGYERPVYLLYGLLRKDKGLDVAVKAFERVGKGTLLLVGKPLSEEDEEVVERAKEAGAVHIPGFADDELLGTLIRSADFVLLPYEDLPNDFGISGAFHTTIATGGYPLCSRVQRLVECWERTKELTFRPGDAVGLARLMSSHKLPDAWGRLRAYAELTSWDNVAIIRERIYSLLT